MKQAIVYMGNFFFPNGNAAGKRVCGNGQAIKQLGYKMVYIGFSQVGSGNVESQNINGDIVYTLPYSKGVARLNDFFPYKTVKSIINDLSIECEIKAVIMYGSLGTVFFNSMMIGFCHRKGIKIYYDYVDWYDMPDKHNMLKYIYKRLEVTHLRKRVIPSCDGCIAISSFLADSVKPLPSIIVPPLSTQITSPVEINDNDIITFSYATFICDRCRPVSEWKDRIDAIIDVFYNVVQKYNLRNFKINFIGFEKYELIQMFVKEQQDEYREKLDYLRDNIIFWGRMSNDKASDIIAASTFSILLRDSKISTNAGFPTKVSEAMSLSVPVLVNITSDIGRYIRNGDNGIVLEDPSKIEDNAILISEVLKKNASEYSGMKMCVYEERTFYYAKYVDTFKRFFE